MSYVGSVADVASGHVQVGYATVVGLRSTGIYARAAVISRPIGPFQIKVEHVPGSCGVRVTVMDLDTADEHMIQMEKDVSMPCITLREDKLEWAHALTDGSIVEVVDR